MQPALRAARGRGRPPGPSAAEDTRGRILQAAEEVFADRGYQAAAVDEIVQRSGTSKGSFYFHFPSKQAIFQALVAGQADRLARRVEEAIAREPTALARAEAALRVTLEAFAGHRRLARLLLLDAARPAGPAGGVAGVRFESVHERFTAVVQRHLEEALRAGELRPAPGFDPAVAAAAWTGALNEVILRWLRTGQPADPRDALPTLRQMLLSGVGLTR